MLLKIHSMSVCQCRLSMHGHIVILYSLQFLVISNDLWTGATSTSCCTECTFTVLVLYTKHSPMRYKWCLFVTPASVHTVYGVVHTCWAAVRPHSCTHQYFIVWPVRRAHLDLLLPVVHSIYLVSTITQILTTKLLWLFISITRLHTTHTAIGELSSLCKCVTTTSVILVTRFINDDFLSIMLRAYRHPCSPHIVAYAKKNHQNETLTLQRRQYER